MSLSDYTQLIQLSSKIPKPFEVTKGKTIIRLSLLSISQLMVNLSNCTYVYTASKYITIEIVTNGRSIGQPRLVLLISCTSVHGGIIRLN